MRTFRRALLICVIGSLALHLLIGVGGVYFEKTVNRRAAQHDREVLAAKKMREAQAFEKREAARALQNKLKVQDARKQLETQLQENFKELVADKVGEGAAAHIWDDIIEQIKGSLDQTASSMTDQKLSDADLDQQLDQLQGQMLDALTKQIAQMRTQELADSYVKRVGSEVAPRLADYYKKQISDQIGNVIRDRGADIVAGDASEVKKQRAALADAFDKATALAQGARDQLAAAQARLQQLSSAHPQGDAENQSHKDDTKASADAIDQAAGQVSDAQKTLENAAGPVDALSDSVRNAIRSAATEPSAKDTIGAANAASKRAREGDASSAVAAAKDSATNADKFVEALKRGRATLREDEAADADGGDAARNAIKAERDQYLKKQLKDSFARAAEKNLVPGLTDQLAEAFKQTIADAGVNDEKAVDGVRQRVGDLLKTQLKRDIDAGEAGTSPLTSGSNLDKHFAGNWRDGAGPTTRATAANTGDATQPATGSSEPSVLAEASHRQSTIAEKMAHAADQATQDGLQKLTGDRSNDKSIVAAALGQDGPDDKLGDLQRRLSRLASNVRGGHPELAGADNSVTAPGSSGASSASGIGRNAGVGQGGRLRLPHFRNSDVAGNFRDRSRFDASQYAHLTQSIHDRDKQAAQGQVIQLRPTVDAPAGDIATMNAAAKDRLFPAVAIAPPPAAGAATLVGVPEKSEPFRPAFANIRFSAIPYRTTPITIDGDLTEWANVAALEMLPAIEGEKKGIPTFPQQLKVQWDNTGIYVAAELKKADAHIVKAQSGNFWEGDGIEVFVDSLNTKSRDRNKSSHQFWAWVAGSVSDPNQVGGENEEWDGRTNYVPWNREKMKVAGRPTATGWTIEVFIPKERFRQLRLEPGVIVGMNFSLCTGSSLYYYWAGTTDIGTSQRPDTWGDVLLAGSDARVECVDRLAGELKQGESAKPLNYLRIGQPLRIRVTDPVMNLSDASPDRVSVAVKSPDGQPHTLVLVETGNNTGVFEGAMPTMLQTGDEAAGAIALFEGEKISITYLDHCRPDGARDVKINLHIPTAAGLTSTHRQ